MPAFWQHREARVNSYLEPDVFVAAADLDIELELVEEMYQGQYNRDEGFACQMASDLGLINADAVWPGNRIDWSAAARELMYDYGESRGILLSDELLKIL